MFFFDAFTLMFSIVFVIIIGVFVIVFIKNISEWNKNNHSPRLTVDAKLVGKRQDISHHGTQNSAPVHRIYYVTFQVESGDRIEFQVSGSEYGFLVEGDYGKLTFQGSRYLSFERQY